MTSREVSGNPTSHPQRVCGKRPHNGQFEIDGATTNTSLKTMIMFLIDFLITK